MKILHILHSTNIGGTEKAVLNYIKHNNDETIENYVISLNSGILSSQYNSACKKFSVIESNNFFKILSFLYTYINKNEIDIIYAYGLRTSLVARIVSKVTKKKNIYGVRGLQKNSKGLIEIVNKVTLPLVDFIICNSESVTQYLITNLKYDSEKISTIENGTYLPSNKRNNYFKKNEVMEIVCVANFHEIKGHIYLLEAINEIVKEGYKVRLKLVGEGACKEKIIEYTHLNNIQNEVEFLGLLNEVYSVLYESHILVLPSLSEGLPNAIMEAMATELPIIASKVGGIPELIIEKENGILVNPASSKELKEAIITFYNNPEILREFGRNSKKIIEEKFSFETLVCKNNSFFSNMIKL